MIGTISIKEIKQFNSSKIEIVEGRSTAIITATKNYIVINDFKEVFNYLGEIIKDQKIKKLVFDKRKLTVFHQPSMEWYYTEWKEEMYDLGLRSHRKILPNDDFFKMAVKTAKEDINKKFPNGKYTLMDIQYRDTLEEAIEN